MGGLIKVSNVKWGRVLLEDNTEIVFRVAIVDAVPSSEISPFGVEFSVNITTGMAVHPSEESIEEVKDKKTLPPGPQPPLESWAPLRILQKESAVEEVEYEDTSSRKYRIRVEIEPIMTSKNTLFKSLSGDPMYTIRWAPKISWEEI